MSSLHSLDTLEYEIVLIEAETIITPIDNLIISKTAELDTLLNHVGKNVEFSRRQIQEITEIEEMITKNQYDYAELKNLIIHNKKKIINKVELLQKALTLLEDVNNNTFQKCIDEMASHISRLTFDTTCAMNNDIKHELKKYKKYLMNRQAQYANVSKTFFNAKSSMIYYSNLL